MVNLDSFKKNLFSQNGEDGILEEIINRLNKYSDKSCCEFGAWDGKHLSNVYNLISNKSFKGLLIESNLKRFKKLSSINNKNIIPLNKLVSFEGKNKLDNILLENNFNKDFDILSIDIDGNDYYIFESMIEFLPKVIVIEFNPTIPNHIEFIQKKDFKINEGSSARSLFNLAKKKNYNLVATTACNLIFVHNRFKKLITDKHYDINDLLDDKKSKNYIFVGFDGKIFTSKKVILPFHNMKIDKLKFLPKILEKLPEKYNFFIIQKNT